MTYKTLLVSLNEIERLDAVLQLAATLAGEQKSHVIGLYVIPAPAVYPAVGPYVVPEVFDGLTRFFEDQSKGAKKKFDAVMKRGDLSGRWLEIKASAPVISETVSEIGRIAELVVVSETNRDGKNGAELDFVENVILGVGRPVLILPRRSDSDLNTSLVVCGYNGSKESARAVHDAVPILRKAKDVRLIWVDPASDTEPFGAPPGTAMAESLQRQGVKATAESVLSKGVNPAEAVMMKARELGSGLIVMGAYGHSRIREFVLGGATRHALSSLTIPLLMSH
ncbi:MAG TPA: universal stress protein [Aestuariivirgaceae bacterium]|nr:universal stress protein [Aestuariivirgaceae bacterium]